MPHSPDAIPFKKLSLSMFTLVSFCLCDKFLEPCANKHYIVQFQIINKNTVNVAMGNSQFIGKGIKGYLFVRTHTVSKRRWSFSSVVYKEEGRFVRELSSKFV
ncbi:hypothetical protein TNCT_81391 [Trichonephila clavata]|uniref:Uncharacterized protein n=1 Tax=Trichonephila clavata TaxID=2740835 RepID=A0A8X6M568_TRICU|nr:hypothetical protein TNCT_81391 [Trichonephila clavata]